MKWNCPEKENFPCQILCNLLLAPSVKDLHLTSLHGNCRSPFQTSGFTALGQKLKESLAFVISWGKDNTTLQAWILEWEYHPSCNCLHGLPSYVLVIYYFGDFNSNKNLFCTVKDYIRLQYNNFMHPCSLPLLSTMIVKTDVTMSLNGLTDKSRCNPSVIGSVCDPMRQSAIHSQDVPSSWMRFLTQHLLWLENVGALA